MSLKIATTILIAGGFAAFPCFARAQSSEFDQALAQRGAEVRLSFTIPLGGSAEKSKTAPRLGFAVRNYKQSSRPSADWVLANAEPFREARLDFTLEDTPKLLMNGLVLDFGPDTANANALDTYDKTVLTVIGVSLVVIAGTILVLA